jgi:maltose O-acetyltransferase
MKTEREKMLAGELYDPLDAGLVAARVRARELFGAGGDSVWMQPPFFCDYGANIELGERCRSIRSSCPACASAIASSSGRVAW